jgi:hypothetical protein
MDELAKATELQPQNVLEPEAFAPDAVEQWTLEQASALPAEVFRLSSFWHIDFIIQPSSHRSEGSLHRARRTVRELWHCVWPDIGSAK